MAIFIRRIASGQGESMLKKIVLLSFALLLCLALMLTGCKPGETIRTVTATTTVVQTQTQPQQTVSITSTATIVYGVTQTQTVPVTIETITTQTVTLPPATITDTITITITEIIGDIEVLEIILPEVTLRANSIFGITLVVRNTSSIAREYTIPIVIYGAQDHNLVSSYSLGFTIGGKQQIEVVRKG